MRFGENALSVIEDVKSKIEEIEPGLPEGVRIRTAYDRSGLIHRSIDTLKETLAEELTITAIICLVFHTLCLAAQANQHGHRGRVVGDNDCAVEQDRQRVHAAA
jgi:Cu/Ag efflux pump CusA